jgi:hypothetical protein
MFVIFTKYYLGDQINEDGVSCIELVNTVYYSAVILTTPFILPTL